MLPVLTWQAPAQCPDQANVQARMEAALRRVPESSERVEVHGRVAPGGPGWQLQLDLVAAGTAPRRRQLAAASCDELADAAAVAIALALGGSQGEPPGQGASAASGLPAAPPALEVSAQNEPQRSLDTQQPSLQREHRSSVVFGVAGVLDSSMLPGLGWGARLDLQARFDAWGVALYGLWLGEQERELQPGQGAGFGVLAAGVRGCYRPLEGEIALDGCLGLELDSLSASAHGLVVGRDDHERFLVALASTALSWHALPNWAFFARLDGLVPRSRHQFIVNEQQILHETPAFALRLSLGLEGDLAGH